jgi:hypothetical protein
MPLTPTAAPAAAGVPSTPPQDAPSAAPAPLAGPAIAAALPRAYAATGRAVGGLPYLTRRMVTTAGAQAGPGDDPPAEPTDPDLTGGT